MEIFFQVSTFFSFTGVWVLFSILCWCWFAPREKQAAEVMAMSSPNGDATIYLESHAMVSRFETVDLLQRQSPSPYATEV